MEDMRSKKPVVALFLAATLFASTLPADEGLWLLNRFPSKTVEAKYGFTVTDEFLENMRKASVRFNNGGSGSFISPDGLLFTNHHVGSDCIQKLSTAKDDYMNNGFYAATQADEKACPDLEVNVLLQIDDVTAKVNEGVTAQTPPAEANKIRRENMTRLETECTNSTGNRCDIVRLFSGGEYHLYQYKKYTDVRLVLAPEVGIAAFGGDPDNFTYPRYCLDFALFRAYENGSPANVKDYFRWSREGVQDGELVFVPGHPGTTGRLATVSELNFSRDHSYPLIQRRLVSLIQSLQAYSAKGAEAKRIARDNLFSQQNGYKAFTGFLRGLNDPKLMARKAEEEKDLRAKIAADPEKQAAYGKVWDEVEAAYKDYAGFYTEFWLLERGAARGSDLLRLARDVLRYAEEKAKPNQERLREYTDASLPSLEQEMYSSAPIHDEMEIVVLADYFQFLSKELGAEHVVVKEILAGLTPRAVAEHYVRTSKLKDVEERRRLANDLEAVRSTDDGMIRLARILDPRARKLRKDYEDRIEAVITSSASRIAQARFAIFGSNEYPDATFTLRVTYGTVKGYTNSAGQPVPYATRFDGVYKRAKKIEPYRLPQSWSKGKKSLDLTTPFNFVTTTDTHGGNSGSPTLNRKGEVVGILFDGNIEGLPNRFLFTDEQARSVHVASQGIIESMRKIYKADRILKEIGLEN